MLATFIVYLLVHMILRVQEKGMRFEFPLWLQNPYFYIMAGIFMLAMDFWAWNKVQPVFWGIPLWMFYFMGLSAVQTGAMVAWVRKI